MISLSYEVSDHASSNSGVSTNTSYSQPGTPTTRLEPTRLSIDTPAPEMPSVSSASQPISRAPNSGHQIRWSDIRMPRIVDLLLLNTLPLARLGLKIGQLMAAVSSAVTYTTEDAKVTTDPITTRGEFVTSISSDIDEITCTLPLDHDNYIADIELTQLANLGFGGAILGIFALQALVEVLTKLEHDAACRETLRSLEQGVAKAISEYQENAESNQTQHQPHRSLLSQVKPIAERVLNLASGAGAVATAGFIGIRSLLSGFPLTKFTGFEKLDLIDLQNIPFGVTLNPSCTSNFGFVPEPIFALKGTIHIPTIRPEFGIGSEKISQVLGSISLSRLVTFFGMNAIRNSNYTELAYQTTKALLSEELISETNNADHDFSEKLINLLQVKANENMVDPNVVYSISHGLKHLVEAKLIKNRHTHQDNANSNSIPDSESMPPQRTKSIAQWFMPILIWAGKTTIGAANEIFNAAVLIKFIEAGFPYVSQGFGDRQLSEELIISGTLRESFDNMNIPDINIESFANYNVTIPSIDLKEIESSIVLPLLITALSVRLIAGTANNYFHRCTIEKTITQGVNHYKSQHPERPIDSVASKEVLESILDEFQTSNLISKSERHGVKTSDFLSNNNRKIQSIFGFRIINGLKNLSARDIHGKQATHRLLASIGDSFVDTILELGMKFGVFAGSTWLNKIITESFLQGAALVFTNKVLIEFIINGTIPSDDSGLEDEQIPELYFEEEFELPNTPIPSINTTPVQAAIAGVVLAIPLLSHVIYWYLNQNSSRIKGEITRFQNEVIDSPPQ